MVSYGTLLLKTCLPCFVFFLFFLCCCLGSSLLVPVFFFVHVRGMVFLYWFYVDELYNGLEQFFLRECLVLYFIIIFSIITYIIYYYIFIFYIEK